MTRGLGRLLISCWILYSVIAMAYWAVAVNLLENNPEFRGYGHFFVWAFALFTLVCIAVSTGVALVAGRSHRRQSNREGAGAC